jgi:predicted HTH transcriptional regulator
VEDQLRLFFESLQTEADLERLRIEEREENLHLEFTTKEDGRTGELGDGDREAFSKAVSGFANADGGVLVFGVKRIKRQDAPDRAAQLRPIDNVGTFRVRLIDSIIQTTQPAVDGIRIEVIPSELETRGYLKCLVPASDKPPHRGMHGREYWRRTTSGFRRMEHYELEDVFGRRSRPALSRHAPGPYMRSPTTSSCGI